MQVTQWLHRWQAGDRQAEDQLIEAVYGQLHAIAARMIRQERPGHTLRPTALVHEAWLRLHGNSMDFEDRAHFLSFSARVMRRILVDHARARLRGKRFDAKERVCMDEAALALNVSVRTVQREVQFAKLWLKATLQGTL